MDNPARQHRRVAILTGHHLCHNPRVIKEATALAGAGYRVTVLGGWTDAWLKQRDLALMKSAAFTFVAVVDTTERNFQSTAARAKRRAGLEAHRWLGVENSWQLGYAVAALQRAALAFSADLFITHSEQGLVAADALRRRGQAIAVDMEDWFSEDLLPAARKTRPLRMLRRLEQHLLRSCLFSTCPSQAMSVALSAAYGCSPPLVIYNAFDPPHRRSLELDRVDQSIPSVHWFSQTLGEGRGLEDLIDALHHVRQVAQIHIRGHDAGNVGAQLRNRAPEEWRERIHFHPLVDNDELPLRIAEHDVGFSGDPVSPRSRNLTVTNKMLQYLSCGLPVVASATDGNREIAGQAPDAVRLYQPGDVCDLAHCLNGLLESPPALDRAKSAAAAAAARNFNWQKQAVGLIAAVDRALQIGVAA